MPSNYYLGVSPTEGLGESTRFWYALRRNQDGELFLVRSDQILDNEAYELNIPGPPSEDFEFFEPGVDYFDGINEDHEPAYENLYYPQYKWDDRAMFYYINEEGMFVLRINKGYSYPSGISS